MPASRRCAPRLPSQGGTRSSRRSTAYGGSSFFAPGGDLETRNRRGERRQWLREQPLAVELRRLGRRLPILHDGTVLDGELAFVSRTLGHADLSTTADVYAHLTPAMLERSAARTDRILARRDGASG